MRSDMHKVIVERPRWGGYTAKVRCRIDDVEQSPPQREGVSARHRNRKWSDDHLRPLQRYLEAQTGRPWNAVYAEICARTDRRNVVQRHVHEHLSDFVAVRVVDIDGVWHYEWRGWGLHTLAHDRAPPLWVDPDSGLLLRNRLREQAHREARAERVRKAAVRPEHRRDLDGVHQLHRIDGIWYCVELAELTDADGAPDRIRDAMHGKPLGARAVAAGRTRIAGDLTLFGRPGVYAARKRQLDKRELQRHGLRNDADRA